MKKFMTKCADSLFEWVMSWKYNWFVIICFIEFIIMCVFIAYLIW